MQINNENENYVDRKCKISHFLYVPVNSKHLATINWKTYSIIK